MSVVHRPFFVETTTFPDKDSAKTLSICHVDYSTIANIEIIFA